MRIADLGFFFAGDANAVSQSYYESPNVLPIMATRETMEPNHGKSQAPVLPGFLFTLSTFLFCLNLNPVGCHSQKSMTRRVCCPPICCNGNFFWCSLDCKVSYRFSSIFWDFSHLEGFFQCFQVVNKLIVNVFLDIVSAWELFLLRFGPHNNKTVSEHSSVHNNQRLSEISNLLSRHDVYLPGFHIRRIWPLHQGSFLAKTLWVCPVLCSSSRRSSVVHLPFFFVHGLPDFMGNCTVMYWYVSLGTFLRVDLIMLTNMVPTGGIAPFNECGSCSFLFHKLCVLSDCSL